MFLLGAIANARLKNALVDPGGGSYSNSTMLVGTVTPADFSGSGGTHYLPLTGGLRTDTIEAPLLTFMPVAGVLRNLQIIVTTNARTTPSVFAVRVNGVTTELTATAPPGYTGWIESGLAKSVTIAPGDEVSISLVRGGGTGSFVIYGMVTEFKADAKPTSLLTQARNPATAITTTSVHYGPVEGYGRTTLIGLTTSPTGDVVEQTLHGTGKLFKAHLHIPTNTSDSATDVVLTKNGVATALSITVPAGTTGWFDSGATEVAVAPGDKFGWTFQSPTRTVGGCNLGRLTIAFVSDDGVWNIWGKVPEGSNPSAATPGGSVIQKFTNGAGRLPANDFSEPPVQLRAPFPFRVTGINGAGYYNSVSEGDVNVHVRKNSADMPILMTIPDGTNSTAAVISGTGSTDFARGDLLSIGWLGASFSGCYSAGYTLISDVFDEPETILSTPFWSVPGTIGSTVVSFATASATRYLDPLGQLAPYIGSVTLHTTEGDWRPAAHADGTLGGLAVYISANTRTTATVFTLMVNGVATTTTVSVGAGVTGWVESTGPAADVREGDLLSLRMVTGTGTGSLTIDCTEMGFKGAFGTVSHLKLAGDYSSHNTGVTSTAAMVAPVNGAAEWNSFASAWGNIATPGVPQQWSNLIGTPGVLKNARVNIPSNTSDVAVRFEVFKNGVASGLYIEVPAGGTGVFTNTTDTVDLIAGDRIEWRRWAPVAGTGSFKSGNMQVGITTSEGYDVMAAGTPAQSYQGYNDQTYFLGLPRFQHGTSMDNVHRRSRITGPARLSEVKANYNNSAAGVWTKLDLQKNSVDAISVTLPSAGSQGIVTGSGPVDVVKGDIVALALQTGSFSQALTSWTASFVKPV